MPSFTTPWTYADRVQALAWLQRGQVAGQRVSWFLFFLALAGLLSCAGVLTALVYGLLPGAR